MALSLGNHYHKTLCLEGRMVAPTSPWQTSSQSGPDLVHPWNLECGCPCHLESLWSQDVCVCVCVCVCMCVCVRQGWPGLGGQGGALTTILPSRQPIT
jgi:hypothetical protein